MISEGRYWWKGIKPETFTLFCYREGAGSELARMTGIFLKLQYCRCYGIHPEETTPARDYRLMQEELNRRM